MKLAKFLPISRNGQFHRLGVTYIKDYTKMNTIIITNTTMTLWQFTVTYFIALSIEKDLGNFWETPGLPGNCYIWDVSPLPELHTTIKAPREIYNTETTYRQHTQ